MPELTREEATLLVRKQLQTEPILKRLRLEFAVGQEVDSAEDVRPSKIQLLCLSEQCRDHESTTWRATNEGELGNPLWVFRCTLCDKSEVTFWIEFDIRERREETRPGPSKIKFNKDYVRVAELWKAGQVPPWRARVTRGVRKAFGENIVLVQKGLACVSESYGIGAVAYFRRLVEEEVGAILDVLEEAAELEGDSDLVRRIAEARKETVAASRLKLAVDLIPASLRPGNANPPEVLYRELSLALHNFTEETALESAQLIWETLSYFFEVLKERTERAADYSKRIKALATSRSRE